jgi:hypothetical protein
MSVDHELVGPAGLEPATYGLTSHFGFRRRPRGVRGLDCPFTVALARGRCHPSSLYTFRGMPRLGSGLPFQAVRPGEGFPDFEW